METCATTVFLGESSVDHSPSPSATDGEASNPGQRLRRREPRSKDAVSRRRTKFLDREPNQKAETARIGNEDFEVLHVNIQGFRNSEVELSARIRLMPRKPDIVCLNETFLDASTKEVGLEGYSLAARRDRSDGRQCGGIAVFARLEVAERITLLEKIEVS